MSDARKEPMAGRTSGNSTQIQGHPDQYDRKEQLQDELDDLMFHLTEENYNEEKLFALLKALDEVDPLPEANVFDKQKSFEAFCKRNNLKFDADSALGISAEGCPNSTTASISSHKRSRRLFPKLIAVAAVVALIFSMMTLQASGFNFFQLFSRWTSEIFQLNVQDAQAIIHNNPLEEGEERVYDTPQEMLDELGITAPIVPNEVPERFGEPSVRVVNVVHGVRIYIDYKAEDEYLNILYQQIDLANLADVEKDYKGATSRVINGIKHHFISDQHTEKAIWQNGELKCQITGNITLEEMKAIVDSIYEE